LVDLGTKENVNEISIPIFEDASNGVTKGLYQSFNSMQNMQIHSNKNLPRKSIEIVTPKSNSLNKKSDKKASNSQLKMINALSLHISATDEADLRNGKPVINSNNKIYNNEIKTTDNNNNGIINVIESTKEPDLELNKYKITQDKTNNLRTKSSSTPTKTIRWVKTKQEMKLGPRTKTLKDLFSADNYRKTKFDAEFDNRYYANVENEAFEDLDEILPKNSDLGYFVIYNYILYKNDLFFINYFLKLNIELDW
jgi:hypothetical protein